MTFYELLGAPAGATEEELRRAYLAAARRHHPDAGGDAATMTRLNEAWTVLSDPVARRRYDASLGLPEPDGGAVAFDADLFDARPYHPTPTRQGTMALVPPGIFLGSVAMGSVALVFDSPAMLGGAVVLFALSCLAIAVVTAWTLRSGARRGRR